MVFKPNPLVATKVFRQARLLLVQGFEGKPTSMRMPEMLELEDIYHDALRGEATEAQLAAAVAKVKLLA